MIFIMFHGIFLLIAYTERFLKFSGVKASRNDRSIIGTKKGKKLLKILNGIVRIYICVSVYMYKDSPVFIIGDKKQYQKELLLKYNSKLQF